MEYDFTPEIDALVAEILDEAEWIEAQPSYEDVVRDWPDCPEI